MISSIDHSKPGLSMETVWLTRFDEAPKARRLASTSILRYQQIAAHFFAWWRAHDPAGDVSAVTWSDVNTFVTQHLRRCQCIRRCRRAPHENRAALHHLWCVRPEATQGSEPRPPIEEEIERYETYLRDVCGAAEATRMSRLRYVGAFLKDLFGNIAADLYWDA
jgi:integrase/recombinase XerD